MITTVQRIMNNISKYWYIHVNLQYFQPPKTSVLPTNTFDICTALLYKDFCYLIILFFTVTVMAINPIYKKMICVATDTSGQFCKGNSNTFIQIGRDVNDWKLNMFHKILKKTIYNKLKLWPFFDKGGFNPINLHMFIVMFTNKSTVAYSEYYNIHVFCHIHI